MLENTSWRQTLAPYTVKSNWIATGQVLVTILPFMAIWAVYANVAHVSRLLVIPFAAVLSLFILRFFVLMHDCGHGSLFKSRQANQFFGYLFGVLDGMPQFVWSKNHTFHHNTNGDWVKYGGVFNIITTDQYAKLTAKQQRTYRMIRHPLILIPAGFVYILFNPRFNWALGIVLNVAKIIGQVLKLNFHEALNTAKKWESKYWKGKKDYRHMTYNNVALIAIWVLMSYAVGASNFFWLYVISTSLAGSIGILLFTIQHNFEGSYASDTERLDPSRAAIEGTSMLDLPRFLNWFTADIAYHHIHHLSIAIPNYRLAKCHKDLEHLFTEVKRFGCKDFLSTFDYQLWDSKEQKVVATASVKTSAPAYKGPSETTEVWAQ